MIRNTRNKYNKITCDNNNLLSDDISLLRFPSNPIT